jgi:hypothetical protein
VTLTDRHLRILNRAAFLGGERYKLAIVAADDPEKRWERLTAIDAERATLEIEMQHLYASNN